MEEDKPKMPIWRKILITIQILVSLFVIWILCSGFTGLLTWISMEVCFGKCTVQLFEQYSTYIKVGYGIMVTACTSMYIHRMNKKYNFL